MAELDSQTEYRREPSQIEVVHSFINTVLSKIISLSKEKKRSARNFRHLGAASCYSGKVPSRMLSQQKIA